MLTIEARASVAEQYGSAVSVGNMDRDVIGAMGSARAALAALAVDRAGHIAAELGPELIRARNGGLAGSRHRAAELFAAWLEASQPWAGEIESVDQGALMRFTRRVIDESTVLKCSQCGGGGRMLVLKGGKRVRMVLGLGGNSRAQPMRCDACLGTGRRKVSDVERRRLLGGWRPPAAPGAEPTWRRKVDSFEYSLLWRRRFFWAFKILGEIAGEPRAHLHDALNGDRVRA